ncbi:hypothetical protein [Sphaerisporangium corydalis]|uniref:Uncharacterized protein n=1 Tax=Sphaerisporangium corydalis TaxID=1441875 RepID=A0ABV9E9E6_9ACTN|nr:hypothetical protein [Sphaerisporangium corydalis]
MKNWLLIAVGVVLVLVGALWALQGLGYVGGSFMSGAKEWFAIGLVVAIAGLALAVPALRRQLRTPKN